jgi:ubiquinone/menaquinone biosynthesis C-methylase UbiE
MESRGLREELIAQEKWADALISELFQGDEHILDIGCGDGKVALKMATRRKPMGLIFICSSKRQT